MQSKSASNFRSSIVFGPFGQISHKQSIHFPIIYWWLCGDGAAQAQADQVGPIVRL